MEYSTVEGNKLNTSNYGCQCFRYVKSREYGNSIYVKCAFFRGNSCTCTGMINKQTDLFEIKCPHNHDAAAHESEKIIISNTLNAKLKKFQQ